jgi:hypothetical protein
MLTLLLLGCLPQFVAVPVPGRSEAPADDTAPEGEDTGVVPGDDTASEDSDSAPDTGGGDSVDTSSDTGGAPDTGSGPDTDAEPVACVTVEGASTDVWTPNGDLGALDAGDCAEGAIDGSAGYAYDTLAIEPGTAATVVLESPANLYLVAVRDRRVLAEVWVSAGGELEIPATADTLVVANTVGTAATWTLTAR